MDSRTAEGKADAQARRRIIDPVLRKETVLDEGLMKVILTGHGDPGICRHGENRSHNTEFSFVALPDQGRVLYVDG